MHSTHLRWSFIRIYYQITEYRRLFTSPTNTFYRPVCSPDIQSVSAVEVLIVLYKSSFSYLLTTVCKLVILQFVIHPIMCRKLTFYVMYQVIHNHDMTILNSNRSTLTDRLSMAKLTHKRSFCKYQFISVYVSKIPAICACLLMATSSKQNVTYVVGTAQCS